MMSVSFEGIGRWCATFLAGDVEQGDPVKISANGTVAACSAGDAFCGVAVSERDGACSVQLGGFITLPYSGTAPTVGYAALCADGTGGVKSGGTASYLTVDVDTTEKTVTILL